MRKKVEAVEDEKPKKQSRRAICAIVLCWIVYACSYVGKLGYTANIVQIENDFGILHREAGLVSSFFFFAYGAGQIVNGLLCRKYNLRIVVPIALAVSAACNIAVIFMPSFTPIKFLWLCNGAVLSVLWSSMIRFLSENIDEKNLSRAIVIMGTSVAVGTFMVYGLSTIFVAIGMYRLVFAVAGALLPAVAIAWVTLCRKVAADTPQNVRPVQEGTQPEQVQSKRKVMGALWIMLSVVAVFAGIANLTKDGLTTWVPSILKDLYGLPDFLSILLTLALPLCAVFGALVATTLYKKIPDFLLLLSFILGVSVVLIGAVIGFLHVGAAIPLICFGLISCLMSSANNVITSMVPLYMRDKMSSGTLAGILDGCCYLGSAVSSYGLGGLADGYGWNAVFWLLFALCAAVACVGTVVAILLKIVKKKAPKA